MEAYNGRVVTPSYEMDLRERLIVALHGKLIVEGDETTDELQEALHYWDIAKGWEDA